MKLKQRIIFIFIVSIVISVVIFACISGILLFKVFSLGYDDQDMAAAANKIADELIALSKPDKTQIAKEMGRWEGLYKGMEFEVMDDSSDIIYSSRGRAGKYTYTGLQNYPYRYGREWVIARDIYFSGNEKGFLVISVPNEHHVAIVLHVTGRGVGIIAIIFAMGLGITLMISSLLAGFLTRDISGKFDMLYRGMNSFEAVYTGRKNEARKDEISSLVSIFNNMVERINYQMIKERELNEERQKLITNISHDLRTPLTSIIGYSETLKNNIYDNEEEHRKYVEIIYKKARYMDMLMKELFDYSKMQKADFTLNKTQEDIHELCREILIEYIPVFKMKNMDCEIDIPDSPMILSIDKDKLSRGIRNLIDNAIKYGDKGGFLGFQIGAEVINQEISIIIQDKGIGMAKEHLDKIFQRFYRIDKGRNSEAGGLGLGLAIAQEIIKLHQGSIIIESEEGQGTRVIIKLPMQ